MEADKYEVLIIGSGQGGNPLATAFAQAGRRTAVIEREHVGGTCANEGCTPTKTMIASARVAYLAGRAADFGVHTNGSRTELAIVRQRKRDVVSLWHESGVRHLQDAGVDLIWGEGVFAAPHELEIRLNDGGSRRLTAETIIINTGNRPAVPPVPGLDQVPFLNSTTIMELEDAPEHLIVIGGGYVGLEFGQMFRRFGSRVTILQRGGHLLNREDPDIAEAVREILVQDDIDVRLHCHASRVSKRNGKIHLEVNGSGGSRIIEGSHVLAAAGRRPNTDRLQLDNAGIATDDRGYIRVNERLETGVEGIYAIGDVTGGPQFTHISYDDFRILRTNLIDGGSASVANRIVPYTVFIDPQLGRVGLSEQDARKAGYKVRVAKLPMTSVARAIETDETRGLLKAVVDAESDQILGAAVLSVDGGELAALIQVAMMGSLPSRALREGIFTHPSFAESMNRLFGTFTD